MIFLQYGTWCKALPTRFRFSAQFFRDEIAARASDTAATGAAVHPGSQTFDKTLCGTAKLRMGC